LLLHLHFSFAAAAVTATTTATAKQLVFCMGATVCVCMCVCVCSMHVHVHWKICIYPVALRPSSDSTSSINRPTGTGEFLAPFSHSLLLLPIFGCAFCFCFLVFFFSRQPSTHRLLIFHLTRSCFLPPESTDYLIAPYAN